MRNTGTFVGVAALASALAGCVAALDNGGGKPVADRRRLDVSVSSAVLSVGARVAGIGSSTGAARGMGPFSLSRELPRGLEFDPQQGTISGAAEEASEPAVYTIASTSARTSGSLLLAAAPAGAAFSYALSSVTYTVGVPGPDNVPTFTSGSGANFTVTPALPNGLRLNPTTGVISGTPMVATQETAYQVSANGGAARTTLRISVNPLAPSGLTYQPVRGAEVAGVVFSFHVGQPAELRPSSSGGAPTLYQVDAPLPSGLVLDAASGVIAGTPTAVTSGREVHITARNATGSADVLLSFGVGIGAAASGGAADPAGGAAPGANVPPAANRRASLPTDAVVFAYGAAAGAGPRVRAWSRDGSLRFDFFAYESTFTGGVSIALTDSNCDGYPDIAVAPASGGGPRIRIFDGRDGHSLNDFVVSDFSGGIRVAGGDVIDGACDDLVVAEGRGGAGHLTVFRGPELTRVATWKPFPDYNGGIEIATGPFADIRDRFVIAAVPTAISGNTRRVLVIDPETRQQLARPNTSFLATHDVFMSILHGASITDLVRWWAPDPTESMDWTLALTSANDSGAPGLSVLGNGFLTNYSSRDGRASPYLAQALAAKLRDPNDFNNSPNDSPFAQGWRCEMLLEAPTSLAVVGGAALGSGKDVLVIPISSHAGYANAWQPRVAASFFGGSLPTLASALNTSAYDYRSWSTAYSSIFNGNFWGLNEGAGVKAYVAGYQFPAEDRHHDNVGQYDSAPPAGGSSGGSPTVPTGFVREPSGRMSFINGNQHYCTLANLAIASSLGFNGSNFTAVDALPSNYANDGDCLLPALSFIFNGEYFYTPGNGHFCLYLYNYRVGGPTYPSLPRGEVFDGVCGGEAGFLREDSGRVDFLNGANHACGLVNESVGRALGWTGSNHVSYAGLPGNIQYDGDCFVAAGDFKLGGSGFYANSNGRYCLRMKAWEQDGPTYTGLPGSQAFDGVCAGETGFVQISDGRRFYMNGAGHGCQVVSANLAAQINGGNLTYYPSFPDPHFDGNCQN